MISKVNANMAKNRLVPVASLSKCSILTVNEPGGGAGQSYLYEVQAIAG